MPKKRHYDQLVDDISQCLREMAVENCQTIEEASKNAQQLTQMGLAGQSSIEDFSYCPNGHVCWHGTCQVCK